MKAKGPEKEASRSEASGTAHFTVNVFDSTVVPYLSPPSDRFLDTQDPMTVISKDAHVV